MRGPCWRCMLRTPVRAADVCARVDGGFSIQLTFINCWLKPKLLAEDLNEPILGKDRERQPRRGSDSKLVGAAAAAAAATGGDAAGAAVTVAAPGGGVEGDDVELPQQGRMDTHASLRDKNSNVSKMHAAAEVYPAKTERVFNYLQVFTACVGAFGHGANDVSNAVAPFATVFGLFGSGVVEAEEPVPSWVLAFGGLGIVIGLVRSVCVLRLACARVGLATWHAVSLAPSAHADPAYRQARYR